MAAWDDGFKARQRGEDQTANPHPKGSAERGDWDAGWEDLDEHLRNRDECLRQIGWL